MTTDLERTYHGHLDRQGREISVMQFARLLGDHRYLRVARSTFLDVERGWEYDVSTVWLGIDMSFGGSDRPVLYETMIFTEDESIHNAGMRWTSEEEALYGHCQVARLLATNLWQPVPVFVNYAVPRRPALEPPQKAIGPAA
jgi:hypothetical protein